MNTNVEEPVCPRCGSPVPAGAPGGQCPKCLLGAVAAVTEPPPTPPVAGAWPTLDEVRAAFPDLEVEREIGRGGMAIVCKARQLHLDRPVALKVLAPWLAAEAGFAERFSREARVLARLNHPNIVTIHDFGQAAGYFYLLMEYMDGVNLRQAMQAGRFEPAHALALVPKICDALQYAHGEGILHRDIKPDNILLDARGRVKIADFGIAKLAGEKEPSVTLTRSGMRLGTPAYMAPEQVETPADVDHRADIYSLGVVLYEMLTGELPLGRFAPPSEKASVDQRIDEIVLRTLEKERERRYQSAEEMKTRVEGLGSAPTPPAPPQPPSSGWQSAGGAAAGVAAAGVGSSEGWSRKAVWGAVATALSLCGIVLLLPAWVVTESRTVTMEGPRAVVPAPVSLLGLVVVLGALAASALAGILLGASALTDIHRSGGRRAGAGLAAFASLTWPLLLLTGIATGLCATMASADVFERAHSRMGVDLLKPLVFLSGIGLVMWLDFTIVRRVLRWARGGAVQSGGLAAPPMTAVTRTDDGPASPANAVRTSGMAVAAGILALISTVPVVVMGGLFMPGLLLHDRVGPIGGVGPAEVAILLCVSVVPLILAFVLGLVAMRRIRRSHGLLRGAGWAVLGGVTLPVMIVSAVALVIAGLTVTRLVPGPRGGNMSIGLGLTLSVFFVIGMVRAAVSWTRGGSAAWTWKRRDLWVMGAAAMVLLLVPLVSAMSRHSGRLFGGQTLRSAADWLPPAGADVAHVVVNQAMETVEWTQARPEQVQRFELNVAATLGAHRRLICELRHTAAGSSEARVWQAESASSMVTGGLASGDITIHRRFILELPPESGTEALQEAHGQINRRWLHRPNAVALGRPERLFRVSLPDGSTFEASFVLQPADLSI